MNIRDPDPTLPQAIALLRSNRLLEAQSLLASICSNEVASAEHWFLYGAVEHMLGRVDAALTAFEHALVLQPDHARAANGRASLLASLDRIDEALEGLRRLLAVRPNDVDAHVNMAILLDQSGDGRSALEHYDTALALDASHRTARLNRSAILLATRQFEAALHDISVLLRANPQDAAALVNAAKALLALDRFADVVDACRSLIAIDQRHIGARIDQGVALSCLGRFDEARAAFAAARTADSTRFAQIQRQAWNAAGQNLRQGWTHTVDDPPDPRVIYITRGVDRLARGDWTERTPFLSRLEALVREGVARGDPICDWSLPFASTWLPIADDVRRALTQAVARRVEASAAHLPGRPGALLRRHREPLRIGYVSTKFRNHPGATLCPPILEQHDRARVTVYGYALNPHDPGAVAERFRRSCNHVRECYGMGDMEIAQRIRDDGIHVLVDVGGYTDYARPEVFALRAAPVQVAYLGYMASLHAPWIDYFVTDAVATPPEYASLWLERLVYLPRTLLCYDAPPPELPSSSSREECGLPSNGFVFCCFNNSYKLEPRAFSIWMRLLRQVPWSVLWLLRDEAMVHNLRASAAAHGVDPQRLVFADRIDRAAHLVRQRHADLFLDTFDYNAHTTAAEAYYAGLPVLTLPGRTTVARCGASIALGVGMGELIARDEADYERLGLRLATHPEYLASLKMRLAGERAHRPLFDPASLARAFEHAYERMWSHHEAGNAPVTFALGPEALERRYELSLIAPYVRDIPSVDERGECPQSKIR
jgi:protein O-GlcNAc transferase